MHEMVKVCLEKSKESSTDRFNKNCPPYRSHLIIAKKTKMYHTILNSILFSQRPIFTQMEQ